MSVVEYIAYIQKHVNGQWIFMAYLWPAAEQWKQCCTYHSCCIIRRHVKKKLPTKLNFIMNSFLSSVIVIFGSNFKKSLCDFKQYVWCRWYSINYEYFQYSILPSLITLILAIFLFCRPQKIISSIYIFWLCNEYNTKSE